MKRHIFIGLFVFFLLFLSAPAHAQWADRIVLYLPNRIIDIFDIFTLDLGAGATVHGEIYATQACKLGARIGYNVMLVKEHHRQYGYAVQNGYSWFLPGMTMEDIQRKPTSSLVQDFWYNHPAGFPERSDLIYDPQNGARDYWECGVSVSNVVVDVTCAVHPLELADAMLGFFFIDLSNDDLTFENFF